MNIVPTGMHYANFVTGLRFYFNGACIRQVGFFNLEAAFGSPEIVG